MRTREQQIANHKMWFEEPDTVMLEIHGDITVEDARRIMAEQAAITAGRSYIFLMADVAGFSSISSEARRIFAESAKVTPPSVLACFGMNFRGRVLAELLFKAVNVFTKKKNNKYRIFDDGAAARAALAELRPEYAAMEPRV